ncbi:MAG TPA: glycoside hydrolase family 97 N-terminal domain-containing protein, partial [Candidatus Sulfotelmatobacter sp.]|nr:glycoside hydrolase family 97 N-terminal domain-containing protein [Candidatus Sulfotelmatobacter sp.]
MKSVLMALLGLLPATLPAATNSWWLGSPDGRCAISVTLSTGGELTYQAFRAGKPVLLPSPLGLCREDEAFDHGLTLAEAGNIESRREQYELFAGVTPQVDHLLNHRRLVFSNTNHARLALELAASDEGVAFRYRF